MNLQRNDSSAGPEVPSEAKIFRPVLQPSESIPPIGTYRVKQTTDKCPCIHTDMLFYHRECALCTASYVLNSLNGKPCIKVTMGVEYIITEQKVRECKNFCTCGKICVLVSASVCEVSHVSFTTPNCKRNSRQLFSRSNRRHELWCEKKTVTFLLCVRLGTLTWTAAGSASAVTVATRRLFSPSQCRTMLPAWSSTSQR